MKKLITIIAAIIFASLCLAGISTTTNIMPAQVCTTDAFTFTFPIQSTSDLKVITINTSTYDVNTLTLSTDYTVSATNNDYSSGGTVTTAITYGSGYKLIIYRDTTQTQTTTLISDTGVLRTRNIVSALDKQMMILQDIQEQTDRSLKAPVDINSVSMEIPSQTERAGKYLAFNSSGVPVATSVITTGTTSFSTFGSDWVALANVNAALAVLNTPIMPDGSVDYAHNQSMAGYKITGYGTPTDENDVVDVNYVKDSTITLKNKTLESTVINTGVSGTAIDNDGNLAANSATILATQYATKKYSDTKIAAAVAGTGFLKANTAVSTPIFNTTLTAGDTWQTLDVSALGTPAVGANFAILYLEVKASAAGSFAAKPYGLGGANVTDHYASTYPRGGAVMQAVNADDMAYLVVPTDAAGKISIGANNNSTTYTIKLIGYIN